MKHEAVMTHSLWGNSSLFFGKKVPCLDWTWTHYNQRYCLHCNKCPEVNEWPILFPMYYRYCTCTCVTSNKTNEFGTIVVWEVCLDGCFGLFLSFSLIIRDHHALNILMLFRPFLFFCSFILILCWESICVVYSILWDSYLDETHHLLLMLTALLLSA